MNGLQQRRIIYIVLFMLSLSLAIGLILYALKQNINVFLTPSDLLNLSSPAHQTIRLGGMVKPASIVHSSNNLEVHFIITDLKHEIKVSYTGVLPDLFREGKGVIAEGTLNQPGVLTATMILAKHDENYHPPQQTNNITLNKSILKKQVASC